MKSYLLTGLSLLLLAACSSIATPTYQPETIINQTGLTLRLLNIEQNVSPGKAFRPTIYADVIRPPQVAELKTLDRKNLATNSMGMAITLHSPHHKKPLHAYLVTYPVYGNNGALSRLAIRLTPSQRKQARQGKTVMAYGSYRASGHEYLGWIMWLANQSLDVDCGCS